MGENLFLLVALATWEGRLRDWLDIPLHAIHELHGISFLLLGAVALIVRSSETKLPMARRLWLLGVFGVLHGLVELIELERSLRPTSMTLAWVSASLEVASFVALLELGRSSARDVLASRWLSAWLVHGSSLVAAALAMQTSSDSLSGLLLGSRYFIAMPGALITGSALLAHRARARTRLDLAPIAPSLTVAATAFLVYGVLTLFAETAPAYPTWAPTESDFRTFTNVPVALARTACAVAVAVSFVVLVRRASHIGAADLTRVVDTLNGFVYRCRNDPDWTMLYMSDGVLELSGYRAEEFLSRERSYGDLIDPLDQQAVWDSVQAALKDRRDFELSYRIRARTGETRWVYERGRGVFDAQGKLLSLDGHVMNDTVRTLALQDLREKNETVQRALAEQSRLAQELAQERDFAQNLIATAPAIILLLDEQGRIHDANPHFEDLVGYSVDEVRGKDWFQTFLPERDRKRMRALFETAKGPIRARGYVQPIVTRSGQELEIEWYDQIMRARDHRPMLVLAVGQDLSDRKRSVDALRRSQRELREILDSMFAFVGLFSLDGRIIELNRAPLTATGLEREDVLGRLLWDSPFVGTGVDNREQVIAMFARAVAGEAVRRDLRMRVAGDQHITIDAVFAPVHDESGAIVRVVASGVDVTEQRSAEHERRELESQLRQAQRLDALGTLAGGIAHDFNNVLTAILGNVALARLKHVKSQDVGEALEEIARASRRAQDLVRRILAFGRQQAHALDSISIVPVIEEAVTLLRATLPARVSVELDASDSTLRAIADSSQVHQVIMNVITNAWHALGDRAGRVQVRIAAAEGTLPTELAGNAYVLIEVKDDGEGMEADTLQRVFEPFFTTKPPGHGTGLGLSVVHGIMQGHGGAITLESELGRGTTARLYFRKATAAAASEQPEAKPEAALGRGQRILLVDDEAALVSVSSRLLESFGFRVQAFSDPEQALAAFRRDPDAFDWVLTDQSMPRMSGLELSVALLTLRPGMKIVLMSGFLTPDERRHAADIGIAEVVSKPLAFDRLAARLSGEAPTSARDQGLSEAPQ